MRPSFKLLFWSSLVLTVMLIACNRSAISLSYTNAKDEVPQIGNLHFKFNGTLVPDSVMNKWLDEEYVSFTPKIPGKFRWESSDELVFSPEKPLLPSTQYKASLNNAIIKLSEYKSVKSDEDIEFFTPQMKLNKYNFVWVSAGNSNQAVPQIDLEFNYPVNPEALKGSLNVNIDGKKYDYTMQTMNVSDRVSLIVSGLQVQDKNYNVEVTLGKGLKPENGTLGLEKEVTLKNTIISPYVLAINDVETEHTGTLGIVRVKTSQQILQDKIQPFVDISPAVTYNVELTDDGFILSSEAFNADNVYTLKLLKGLRGKVGGVLREEYSTNLAFGVIDPSISFNNTKGVYLASSGNKNILVDIAGIETVKITVSKIYESNLTALNKYGYYPSDNNNEYDDYYYEDAYRDNKATLGDIIYEKEVNTKDLAKHGNARLFNFNIADNLQDFKGIYHIKISSTKDYWVSDARFISLSDIGLIAKEADDKVYVFANNIKTTAPIGDVGVSVYGSNNQLLGTGSTNSSGVAEITYTRKEYEGFKPAMIIAKTKDDFNYLPFYNTAVNTSRFDVGGKKLNKTNFDAFLYMERDMYRPGERVNFAAILRDYSFKNPGSLPVKFRIVMPNGKELTTIRKTLNEQGGVDANVSINASAITGTYNIEMLNGNDVLLTAKSFHVEEFMPDRIKVEPKLDKTIVEPGGTTNLSVKAVNYFGPPAANRKYEVEIQVDEKTFIPKKYNNYNFRLSNQYSYFDKIFKEGKLDENGFASESFNVPDMYRNSGLLQAKFFTTVFDESGRPVSRMAKADIPTQKAFIGLANTEYYYLPLNAEAKFPLVALNLNEEVTTAKVNVQVIKTEYRTILSKSGSYFRYHSQKDEKLLENKSVTISGENTHFSFVPKTSGEYEIRVSMPDAKSYISQHFYSYGSYGFSNNDFGVNTDGNIDISIDKETYNNGETVKALFKAPFNGKMLVTTETNKVVKYEYVDVVNRTATMEFKLSDNDVPNMFITATLFKPHDVSEIPLTAAHGYRKVIVEDLSKQMKVTITANDKSRSNTKQKVTVNAESGAMITLAAVDNGVLAVSDFQTPNPFKYFYSPRALGVRSFDMYPLLMPEIAGRMSSTGGDAEMMAKFAANPLENKRVKILSFWSGTQKANGSGNAEFEIDIPQFSGQIKLMAVAYKDNKLGGSDKAITVADPLVLSAALPRFLSPSDTVSVPVTVTNTTNNTANITATITLSGPLKLMSAASQSATVAANSESIVNFKLYAEQTVNTAKVKVDVKGLGETFTSTTDITVRPPSTLQSRSESGIVTGGSNKALQINTADFLPQSLNYQLVVSKSPVIQLSKQLEYLVNYPHGCTEQTISAAFPQLYYADIAEQLKTGKNKVASALDNINVAINKIKMRQLYNGAVTMWDGQGTENRWMTAYAAHFLVEAQKAGYNVDRNLLDPMLNYLTNSLRNKNLVDYYYNGSLNKKIAPKEIAYSLYVLALANKPNISAMNYYKSNQQVLAMDSKYLLAAAYALVGDKAKFKEMLPGSFGSEVSVAQTGGSFYSDIRDAGVALNALVDVEPTNNQIASLSKYVIDRLKARTYFSTQEAAFGLLGVGKIARNANQSTAKADIIVNGKSVATMNGAAVSLSKQQLGNGSVQINTSGNGAVYYWWQVQGVSLSGDYVEADNYLKVRRQFFSRNGSPISGTTFRQNDLIVVRVTVEKSYSDAIDNVVTTDILPAGFEIENSRIREIPGMDWIKDASTPQQLDMRDDRVNFYDDIYGKRTYYYAVRAVSPGVYRMGPVSSQAMYNGGMNSFNGAGKIEIVP